MWARSNEENMQKREGMTSVITQDYNFEFAGRLSCDKRVWCLKATQVNKTTAKNYLCTGSYEMVLLLTDVRKGVVRLVG